MRKMKASRVLLFAAACILTVIYIFPFVLTIFNSMKTSQEFIMNPFSLPSAFHVENFTQALQEMKFFSALKNTFILTIVSSLLIVPDDGGIHGGSFPGIHDTDREDIWGYLWTE